MSKLTKILIRTKLISELCKIRAQMELNVPKSKQMLTNLINNLLEDKGVCIKELKEIEI